MILSQAIKGFEKDLILKERSSETIRGYMMVLWNFDRFLEKELNGFVYIDEITLLLLEEYLSFRKENGDKPVSRNRHLYIIRSFYNYLMRNDLVDVDISKKSEPVKTHQKEREYLTQIEMDKLINAIEHPVIKAAIYTFCYTGVRMAELINLQMKDVDFENNLIKVISGKGNKDRTIPINKKLREVLINYLEEDRPYVNSSSFFATGSGKVSRQYINQIINTTVKKLGWKKHITAHILRHSFASALIRNNVPLPTVQSLLGHSDLRVTGKYIHQDLEELHNAINVI